MKHVTLSNSHYIRYLHNVLGWFISSFFINLRQIYENDSIFVSTNLQQNCTYKCVCTTSTYIHIFLHFNEWYYNRYLKCYTQNKYIVVCPASVKMHFVRIRYVYSFGRLFAIFWTKTFSARKPVETVIQKAIVHI